MAEPLPLVVKLGGSLHASPSRDEWIKALRLWPGPLTLVCGGGPFADAVRAAHSAMRYSDETAHAMALLAMEQYALALANLHDGLTLAETGEEIFAAHRAKRIALWRPSKMVAAAPDIAPCWNVTSDSLAAWLARKLGAHALLLIKSVDVDANLDFATLVAAGIVDAAFPDYAGPLPVHVAGPGSLPLAAEQLSRGERPGWRVGAQKRKIA